MSTKKKFILGSIVAGVGVAIAAYAATKKELESPKMAVVTTNEQGEITVKEVDADITKTMVNKKDDTILKRIKRFVNKKVIKFLAWVTLHMEQIEAAGAVIGLAGAVISIAGSVRDFARGNDIQEKLDNLDRKIDDLNERERQRNNKLGAYVEDCTEVLNTNLKTTDNDILDLAEALGHPLLEHEEGKTA